MKPAIEDIPNRRPVWEALSDLFLDTELQAADYERIGEVLSASPYSIEQIENILYNEVYPICGWNFWDVAGEWVAFDVDWLQKRILNREHSRLKLAGWLQFGRWSMREEWRKVRVRMQEYRAKLEKK